MLAGDAKREWAGNWYLPIVAALAIMVSVAPNYSLGVLMPQVQQSYGWSRAQISAGPLLVSAVMVVLAPLMGGAIDRYGARRVALPGLILFCLALASIALAGPNIATWLVAWAFVALTAVGVKTTVWTAAVVSRFDAARGMAIAVAISGTGLGSSGWPLIATALSERFGWRGAYVGMALGSLLVTLPLVWLCFYDAGDRLRRSADRARVDRALLPGLEARTALLSRRFVQIAIGSFLAVLSLTALIVHFVPVLREAGVSAYGAATIATGIGIGTVAGRLVTGALLDRFSGPLIGLIAFAVPVIACALLAAGQAVSLGFLIATLIGFGAGAELDIIAYFAARYFGTRSFGLIFGTLVGIMSLGSGVGPFIAGAMYDRFGDYQYLFLLVSPLLIISAILIATLGPYPTFAVAAAAGNEPQDAPAPMASPD